MSQRQSLNLREARQQTPAQAIGDWTLSLREAAFDAITETDITQIMRAQVDKAKAGDEKAARFVLDYFTKIPTTTLSVGIRGAVPVENPQRVLDVSPPANGKHRRGDPTDEELDRSIEARNGVHPLWRPSPYPLDDPRHNEVVQQRIAAELPARHPGDQEPNLE